MSQPSNPLALLPAAEAATVAAIRQSTATLERLGRGTVDAAIADLKTAAHEAAARLAAARQTLHALVAGVVGDLDAFSAEIAEALTADAWPEANDMGRLDGRLAGMSVAANGYATAEEDSGDGVIVMEKQADPPAVEKKADACPACGGHGWSQADDSGNTPCHACGGTGRIPHPYPPAEVATVAANAPAAEKEVKPADAARRTRKGKKGGKSS